MQSEEVITDGSSISIIAETAISEMKKHVDKEKEQGDARQFLPQLDLSSCNSDRIISSANFCKSGFAVNYDSIPTSWFYNAETRKDLDVFDPGGTLTDAYDSAVQCLSAVHPSTCISLRGLSS